jgi:hypothetical protein
MARMVWRNSSETFASEEFLNLMGHVFTSKYSHERAADISPEDLLFPHTMA